MRFHVGAIPIDDFEPDDSWQSLREPGPLLMQLFALPIAVVLLLVFGVFWKDYLAIEPLEIPSEYTVLFGLATIASLPLLVVVHELLHAVAHPGYGRQSATIIGAWPQKMLFYAHYCGELSRNRFLLVFAMPFVVISLLPQIGRAHV